MRYITIMLVFFITLSPFTLCQSAGDEGYFSSSAAEAIVDKNEALFKFPLNPREYYEWGPWGLQYGWHVEVANNREAKYGLGFSIYGSMSYEPFINGDIRKLLRAGQFDLWKSKAGGDGTLIGLEGVSANGWVKSDGSDGQPIIEKSIVSGYATQRKLVIRLQGEKTIRKIFASQPTEVTFSREMFAMSKGSKPITFRVPVTYTEAFLSTKSNTLFEKRMQQLTARKILEDGDLTSYTLTIAKPLFNELCSVCHGEYGQGRPNYPILNDNNWLYGGSIETIEQTITNSRKGVMTAHVRVLKPEEIHSLVKAVMEGEPAEEPLYKAKGCIACHGPEGKGLQVLGAANLTDTIWRFKADDLEQSVKNTILHGVNYAGDPKSREAIMPKFRDRLSKDEIRKLAVYVYSLGGGQ